MLTIMVAVALAQVPPDFAAKLEQPRVPDEWIVWLSGPRPKLNKLELVHDWDPFLHLRGSTEAVIALFSESSVKDISPNYQGRLDGIQDSGGGPLPFSSALDRIDQRGPVPLSSERYLYSNTGNGVTAYVLDDSALANHVDWNRTAAEVRAFGPSGSRLLNVFDATEGAGAGIQVEHGTQMASALGGARGGAAKGASIRVIDVVRQFGVSNPAPEAAYVLNAITWVKANHPAGAPGVVLMALEFPADSIIDAAVTDLIASANVTVVAAAGNALPMQSPVDASTISPARIPAVITVGNMNSTWSNFDSVFSTSNYGSVLDFYAPGVSVVAAINAGPSQYGSAGNGTSPAAALAAGVAARYLELNPNAPPSSVQAALVAAATTGTLSNVPAGSPNKLLFSGFIGTRLNPSPSARLGTSRDDSALAVDSRSGNRVLGGNRNGGGSVWPCSLSFGGDGFVTKFTDTTPAWTTVIPAPNWNCGPKDYASVVGVAFDVAGDVYAAVNFYSAPFSSPTFSQAWLYKLSASSGSVIWSTQIGANASSGTRLLATSPGGTAAQIVLTGYTQDAIPGTTALGGVDGFAASFNTSGTRLWATKFGSNGTDVSSAIVASGFSVVIGGASSGVLANSRNLSGQLVTANQGGNDAFIVSIRLDGVVGSITAVLQFGGPGNEGVSGLGNLTPSGVVAVGSTTSTLASPRGGGGGYDAFFVGLSGTLVPLTGWSLQQFGSSGDESVSGVYVSPISLTSVTNDFFIAGRTSGSLGATNPGGDDVYVTKYTDQGVLRWDWQNAIVGNQSPAAITGAGSATDGPADLYVVGTADGTSWCGSPMGGADAFSGVFEGY